LEILLVNFREKPDHLRQVVRERGYVAPVLLDESGDVTGKAYGVWGPPTCPSPKSSSTQWTTADALATG